MAAGLGFKTFTTGEVLTAADTNGYLMQGVLVFASSAARAAAITSPQEGQYSYLKDTNSTEYYDGAAWIAAPIGDITGVTAGTGISGGGTSGTVTITNSMATEIAAKGDLIVGTGSATFDNLTVGTNGQTLVADSTASTGLKWATPSSGGGMTLLSTTTLSGTSTTISSISGSYKHLLMVAKDMTAATNGDGWFVRFNSDTGNNYSSIAIRQIGNTVSGTNDLSISSLDICNRLQNAATIDKYGSAEVWIYRYTDTDSINTFSRSYGNSGAPAAYCDTRTGRYDNSAAITSITILGNSALGGTIYLYGVN